MTERQIFAHANSKLVAAYWQRLRGGAAAPRQRELHPANIKPALPNLFVLQKFDANHIVFRLAGTGYCAMFGKEFRMQNFLAMTGGASRKYMSVLLDRVLDVPCVGIARIRAETLGGSFCELEYLFLPLADADWRLNRILGTANIVDWGTASVYDCFVKQSILSLEIADPIELPASKASPMRTRAALRRPTRPRLEVVAPD